MSTNDLFFTNYIFHFRIKRKIISVKMTHTNVILIHHQFTILFIASCVLFFSPIIKEVLNKTYDFIKDLFFELIYCHQINIFFIQ